MTIAANIRANRQDLANVDRALLGLHVPRDMPGAYNVQRARLMIKVAQEELALAVVAGVDRVIEHTA